MLQRITSGRRGANRVDMGEERQLVVAHYCTEEPSVREQAVRIRRWSLNINFSASKSCTRLAHYTSFTEPQTFRAWQLMAKHRRAQPESSFRPPVRGQCKV